MPGTSLTTTGGVSIVAGGALLLGALFLTAASPSAQRGTYDNESKGAPVSTNRILQNPDAYYGKLITVSAGVEQMVSKTAFVVDQRKVVAHEVTSLGKPMLVIAPYLTKDLEQKKYFVVRGQLMKFDPESIARAVPDYKLDLPPEMGAKYKGMPVLLANSVINSTYIELAKKPLPPPSASELTFITTMKAIGPAFTAMRTASTETKGDVVKEHAAKLQPAFTQAETIWDDLGQSPAAQYARDARAHSAAIEKAAAAGNWDQVKTSSMALNQVCTNCHNAYRERLDDGTFRFKPGTF